MKSALLPSVLISLLSLGSPLIAADTKPQTTATPTSTPVSEAVVVIDCSYKIPAGTVKVDDAVLIQWAEKATKQAFDFKHDLIDKQLIDLKACFTESGWQSFSDALQKSGNVAAIKAQKLNVTSTVTGTSQVTKTQENQWKINIPLEVVYQNEKDNLKQGLVVDLLVQRKPTNDLGIMQIVVVPKPANTAAPGANPPVTATGTPGANPNANATQATPSANPSTSSRAQKTNSH